MTNTATLISLRSRLRAWLMDAAKAVWTDDATLDEALRLAVQELSRPTSLPAANLRLGLVTPANGAREVVLTTLPDLLDVLEVWFPFAATDDPPRRVEFVELVDNGARTVRLLGATAGDGVSPARVLYRAAHTLSGLDGATATTWPPPLDGAVLTGAAGYALLAKSVDMIEDTLKGTFSAPNYAELGARLLQDYRAMLGLAAYVTDSSFNLAAYEPSQKKKGK